MSKEEELWNMRNKYYNIVIGPSFTTRKLKELQKENEQLKNNWNKLKEYLNYKSERAVGEDEYVYDEIYNEMLELEQGSDNQ